MANKNDREQVLLEIQHLKKYYSGRHGMKAVDDVSFSINKGEVLGIVGESGCGKTSMARTIMKIYEATGGKIFFNGECISVGIPELKENYRYAIKDKNGELANKLAAELEEGKRINKKYMAGNIGKIQMVFQDPAASLDPRMTVREIIAEGLIINGIKDRTYIDRKVREVLDMVGLLLEHENRYPHEFSGGQRQRIGIARALIMEPKLIIADEPVSALDVSAQAQVINLLSELKEKMGLTIMFIAHDLSVVKYISDRIAVMYRGRIVELAETEELFERPCHPYTKSLLSSIPVPNPYLEKRREGIIYNAKAYSDNWERRELREVSSGHYVLCD